MNRVVDPVAAMIALLAIVFDGSGMFSARRSLPVRIIISVGLAVALLAPCACPRRSTADPSPVDQLLAAETGAAAAAVVDFDQMPRLTLARSVAAMPVSSAAAAALHTGQSFLSTESAETRRSAFASDFRPLSGCSVMPSQPGDGGRLLPAVVLHEPEPAVRAYIEQTRAAFSVMSHHRLQCSQGGPWLVGILAGRVVALVDLAPVSVSPDNRFAAFLTKGAEEAPPEMLPVDVILTGVDGATVTVNGATHPVPHTITGQNPGATLRFTWNAPGREPTEVVAEVVSRQLLLPPGQVAPRGEPQRWWVP